jgi:hypothetical protein
MRATLVAAAALLAFGGAAFAQQTWLYPQVGGGYRINAPACTREADLGGRLGKDQSLDESQHSSASPK